MVEQRRRNSTSSPSLPLLVPTSSAMSSASMQTPMALASPTPSASSATSSNSSCGIASDDAPPPSTLTTTTATVVVVAPKKTSRKLKSTDVDANGTLPVWRKSSHPPLSSVNVDGSYRYLRDLQLQLKKAGTKDDWATITCHFMSENSCRPCDYGENDLLDDDDEDMDYDSDASTPTSSLKRRRRPVSPSVYHRLLLATDDLNTLIRCIMLEAQRLMRAETCTVFLLDAEHQVLVTKVFNRSGEIVDDLRVPMNHGIVGRVAVTRAMMNVRDAHRSAFFYSRVDEINGFRTRNVLCFPIIDNAGTFVGVAELCNKRSPWSGFSRHDELRAETFAVYCATSISHCLLCKKVQEAQRRTHMATEMLVQGSQILVREEEVRLLAAAPIREWWHWHHNFTHFSFPPRSIGDCNFHGAVITMFEDLGFIKRYRMSKRKLAYFVLRVAGGYRNYEQVPYHNWSHAFAVAHFCWLTLRTRAARQALDELERLSLLIACLCHDIDHRGTTNSFQLQSKTPLAQLYSSEGSVLERHHYAQTVSILQTAECNLLEQLTTVQYKTVLSHIRDIILATDIAAHMNKAPRIRQMVHEGYDQLSVDHHYLLMCLVMTASDLSDQSKNFHNSKAIAENIYHEFFAQGDLEAELGQKPSEMMDRGRAHVPLIQLDFMDSIGVPVFEMLSQIVPEGQPTFEAIRANRRCWQALQEELTATGEKCIGLDYLRDDELERRVFERVRREDPHAADIASTSLNGERRDQDGYAPKATTTTSSSASSASSTSRWSQATTATTSSSPRRTAAAAAAAVAMASPVPAPTKVSTSSAIPNGHHAMPPESSASTSWTNHSPPKAKR